MHILDAAMGRISGNTSIAPNSEPSPGCPTTDSFFYNRLRKLGPDEPRTSYYLNSRTYLHHLGDDPDKDTPVFGNGLSPLVSMTETDFPIVSVPSGSSYALGIVVHGVQNETTLYFAKLSEVHDASVSWRKLLDVA